MEAHLHVAMREDGEFGVLVQIEWVQLDIEAVSEVNLEVLKLR